LYLREEEDLGGGGGDGGGGSGIVMAGSGGGGASLGQSMKRKERLNKAYALLTDPKVTLTRSFLLTIAHARDGCRSVECVLNCKRVCACAEFVFGGYGAGAVREPSVPARRALSLREDEAVRRSALFRSSFFFVSIEFNKSLYHCCVVDSVRFCSIT
jgi:hypothetical protein